MGLPERWCQLPSSWGVAYLLRTWLPELQSGLFAWIHGTKCHSWTADDASAHHITSSLLPRQGVLPADEIARGTVPEGSIAYEADGGIEEGGGANAQASGLLHICNLPRRLQGVLRTPKPQSCDSPPLRTAPRHSTTPATLLKGSGRLVGPADEGTQAEARGVPNTPETACCCVSLAQEGVKLLSRAGLAVVGSVGGRGQHRDLNEDETEAVGKCYAAQRLHSKVPVKSCKATSCAGFALRPCCMLQVL